MAWFKKKQQIENKQVEPTINKKSSDYVGYVFNSSSGTSYIDPLYAYWLYENSDCVGNAVSRICKSFQSIKPVLRNKMTGEFIINENEHPALFLLNNPGYDMNSDRLKFELMKSYLLAGETYPILVGNVNYTPIGLSVSGANKTNLAEDSDGSVSKIYITRGSYNDLYNKEFFNKNNIYVTNDQLKETRQIINERKSLGVRGVSPLQRIYYQTLTKYYGNIHNSGLLKNGARPGGLWSVDEPMDQDNFEAFKNEVRNKFTGASNSGRDIVGNGSVKYQNLILNPRDMDFVNLMRESSQDIYTQYNIPLPLVATSTMTMSNYQNAIESYYDLAVIPEARFIYNQVGRFLLGRYKDGNNYELVIDERDITALKDRMINRAKTMSQVYAFSDNEIRSATGYEARNDGDQVYKPANLISMAIDDYTDDNINLEVDDE